jgi:hypothetical protein
MTWQCISQVDANGLKSAVHPMQSTSLMKIYCGIKVKKVGMATASAKRINAVPV